ncbi:hypothetical protein [Mycoplana sp. MJR14]|uniref:hypothetical protein n=1 Tax=Mycoplana sp. MJR14 TaxID=3032583 RepID=UPI0023DC3C49|nr:hypothetical protein [Mycoplana sp. MJR14]MDF1634385.1 hypothetical protein [Mycoplana sp. MJR14]
MSKAHPHVAIVEQEFLIAVDAEYLISEALDCRVTIAREDEMMRWTPSDLAALDLCLIDLPTEATGALALAARLEEIGVAFAFTSASDLHRSGAPAFEGVPVVMKPYDDVLLAVVRQMLADARCRQN